MIDLQKSRGGLTVADLSVAVVIAATVESVVSTPGLREQSLPEWCRLVRPRDERRR